MFHIGRARHPGPGPRVFTSGQLSIDFVNDGGLLLVIQLWVLCSVPGGS